MNIVVTGAGKGIGYAIALRLAGDGHQVIAVSRNTSAFGNTAPAGIIPLALDLESEQAASLLSAQIQQHFASLDVLINNAGYLVNKPFDQQSSEDFDRQFAVNVKIPFLLIKEFLPMFSANAHVVNISSMGGFQGSAKYPGLSLYSASKAALIALTECFAVEESAKHIAVNCIASGAVQTEMLAKAFPGYQAPLSASDAAEFIADFALRGHQWFRGKVIPMTLSNP
jgi:NAD(P)-dependent dehydrogenase (short-subunit alcohol dehydrogenase family)